MPNNNHCVMCDEIIPEGQQVCPNCFVKTQKHEETNKMKNWQAIQKMNKKEMAAVFFLFLKPFTKQLSKKETEELMQSIEQTLDKEVSA